MDLHEGKLTTEFSVRQAGTGYAELHLKLEKALALYIHPLGDVNKRWISLACLSSGASSALTPIEMGTWNTVRIEKEAESARLYLNEALIGSVSCPKPVRRGEIALQGLGDLALEIDYVEQWGGGGF